LANDGRDFSFFAGARVIELGCGPFGMIHYLEEAAERIGVDPLIEDYAAMGLLQDGGVRHVAGRGESPLLAEGSADIVISYNVLDHVEAPLAYLLQARRLLAPGGRLYFNCHAYRRLPNIVLSRLALIDRPHPWHFSVRALAELLAAAGFVIEGTRTYPLNMGGGLFPWLARKFVVHHMALARPRPGPTG
jgi:malonyl-CoA O-methyltransferase